MTTKTTNTNTASDAPLTHNERISIVRTHFLNKGYIVHSGLQFGVELVLYTDSPDKVHSDFCIRIVDNDDGRLDWRNIQTLVRMVTDVKKTLIVVMVREVNETNDNTNTGTSDNNGEGSQHASIQHNQRYYTVDEIAIGTEHATFRHKNIPKGVGEQIKPQIKK